MIIGIDGVQWIPENVGEIVAFTDEINEVLARLDRNEDVGIESYGLFAIWTSSSRRRFMQTMRNIALKLLRFSP